jgi:hypothetical protein
MSTLYTDGLNDKNYAQVDKKYQDDAQVAKRLTISLFHKSV